MVVDYIPVKKSQLKWISRHKNTSQFSYNDKPINNEIEEK